jgi:hypothetical protein
MAVRVLRWLTLSRWRRAIGFIPAFAAFQRTYNSGDFSAALGHFERVLASFAGKPPPEYMGVYAQLLQVNRRPRAEVLAILNKVANGEFDGRNRPEARYAVAHARYVLAYLTGQPDTVARWAQARALKPKRGFASNRLILPTDPLLFPVTF